MNSKLNLYNTGQQAAKTSNRKGLGGQTNQRNQYKGVSMSLGGKNNALNTINASGMNTN
jgi:hypothetical protein